MILAQSSNSGIICLSFAVSLLRSAVKRTGAYCFTRSAMVAVCTVSSIEVVSAGKLAALGIFSVSCTGRLFSQAKSMVAARALHKIWLLFILDEFKKKMMKRKISICKRKKEAQTLTV